MLSRGTVYKGKTGMWAFTAHRVTGFLVLLFLLLQRWYIEGVMVGSTKG